MPSSYRILHIEDSPDDSELVRLALRRAAFEFTYERVETEEDYVAQLDAAIPDVILCDYDLPRFSAERALQVMEQRGLDIPFIIVSHHIDQSAAVVAMQQGASDYLPKRDLGRLPKAVDAAVERRKARAERINAQEALRASESMKRSILDSLDSRIATLDADGVILAVNKAWRDFAGARTHLGMRVAEPGDNYFELLRERSEQGSAVAGPILEGIRAVIAGERRFFAMEYQLPIGAGTRWYNANVVPLEGNARGVVLSHRDITDQMMAHIALEQAHRRLQALSKRVLAVQEEERRSISRDLHDDIGQSLAALKIGLHRLAREAAPSQAELVAECVGIADQSLDMLRNLALELRPPQLDQLGLAEALGWLAEHQGAASGLAIRCDTSRLARRPPAALEIACYRIAQEALNNATRHAKAKSILIAVESDDRLLKLTVSDDGVGFDEESSRQRALTAGRLGLIGMEERAQLAGGRLKLRTVQGAGTTLTAIFPLDGGTEPERVADQEAST
jgi:two-component system sensor histidine kinase UhpB